MLLRLLRVVATGMLCSVFCEDLSALYMWVSLPLPCADHSPYNLVRWGKIGRLHVSLRTVWCRIHPRPEEGGYLEKRLYMCPWPQDSRSGLFIVRVYTILCLTTKSQPAFTPLSVVHYGLPPGMALYTTSSHYTHG